MKRALLFLFCALPAFAAAPCTGAKPECTEWVTFAGGPSRSLIYRSYSLDTKNEQIRRALVMVHGAGRDADNYFRTAVAAAFLAGALDDTVVVAPRFASLEGQSCRDVLGPNEVNWPCGGNSWRAGGVAHNDQQLTSFDFVDEVLRKLSRKEVFPNLKAIVVAGHSAGGQFVTRYEMANQVHEWLGVAVTYVVSNPSSYAYPDALRPTPDGAGVQAFGDSRNCTTYNRWPYGFEDRAGYTAHIPDDQLRKQLAARPTMYLFGQLDTLPLGGFDSTCPAMAQGPTRLARGQAFVNYVAQQYGASQHKAVVIELCGHNARCMFTADAALPFLFPQ